MPASTSAWLYMPDVCGKFVCIQDLTSVLGKECLHTAIGSRILSFPPLIGDMVKYSFKDAAVVA